MASKQQSTEIVERVAIQHRVALGLTALTFGAIGMGLAVAFLATPGGVSDTLFVSQQSATVTSASTSNAITLTWTAPGDDGTTGQATMYDLRYSTAPISADNFSSAARDHSIPSPLPSGFTESHTVTGLQADTMYYFAMKSIDEAGNVADMSNVVMKATTALPCTPEYVCSDWSSCVNGQMTKTCQDVNHCPNAVSQPITTQACFGTGGTNTGITNPMVVASAASGSSVKVRILDGTTLKVRREIVPYRSGANGVFVAAGDIDGDRRAEVIVGSGVNRKSEVKLYTERGTLLATFAPYGKSTIGATVAAGDIDGDGKAEIITAPASGTGAIRAFRYNSKTKKVTSLAATTVAKSYRGGFNLAVSDLNLDGKFEILTAQRASANGVAIYRLQGTKLVKGGSFVAYPIRFRSGISVAAGDINGDGLPEILTVGGAGYWADVKAFTSAGKKVAQFLPYPKTFFGGATLASRDVNNDGKDEVLVAPLSASTSTLRTFRFNPALGTFDRLSISTVFPGSSKPGLRLGGI